MITRERLAELIRYATTGALCASLNIGLSMFLTEYAGLHYLVSLAVCSMLVIVVGFFLNRSWTFRMQGTAILAQFVRYALATSANVVIGLVACAFMVEQLHVQYMYAIAIIAIVFAPMIYVVHRVWTFGLTLFYGK